MCPLSHVKQWLLKAGLQIKKPDPCGWFFKVTELELDLLF